MIDPQELGTRLAAVHARIDAAAEAAGRRSADITLIGVTKTHPPVLAQAAVAAGLLDLGENRVQELTAKARHVVGARWHLVGRLQRNKVRDVVGRHILVHAVDRRALADALSARARRDGVVQRILIQVNGDDPAKGGCRLDEVGELVAYARDLPNLTVEGLMTIPPLPPPGANAADAARPLFAAMREQRDTIRESFPEVVHLSMGMSGDLDAAVAEGATMVRIGTALFGPRGDGPWRKDVR
jgi:pyridoxal phosphate enzyme (YggS family)